MAKSVDYDRVAPSYEGRYRRSDYTGVEAAVLEFAGRSPNDRMLEVGCGTGHWLGLLHANGARVAGVDRSVGMLQKARSHVPCTVARAAAEALPWHDQSFDRVLCVNAFHHFADKKAFIREARRVLRPQGRLLTIGLDPHTGLDQWSIYDFFEGTLHADKLRYPPTEEIRHWLAQAGFGQCQSEVVQHMPLRLPAREALAEGRLDKQVTSQLSLLSEDAYAAGVERIKRQIALHEAAGETFYVGGDLRLYGTTATLLGA